MLTAIVIFLNGATVFPGSRAATMDWPCWGYDISRIGASPAALTLPEKLKLHWVRELSPPRRAWLAQRDDGDKLEFDLSYSPIVADGKLFVASMNDDSLAAYDATDGEFLWRFFADGPLRLAPVFWKNKVYAVSDDGRLYCLDAENGQPLWSFSAAPGGHLVLGNRRIISLWPARGAPVVDDGTVYFASGVWPFLGTCVYALDAENGKVKWANTGHSTQWQPQPHGGAFAFSGLSPQGYLALAGDKLVIAGGRSLPALFDRYSGKLLHYNAQAKPLGGYRVMVDDESYYNHGRQYSLADGRPIGQKNPEHEAISILQQRVNALRDSYEGDVFESLAAAGKLYISTRQGRIYCFGASQPETPRQHLLKPPVLPEPAGEGALQAKALLTKFGIHNGYALIPGGADDDFLDALLMHSALHLVVLEPALERCLTLRSRYSAFGLYGDRVAVLPGSLADLKYPEYISSLILVPDPARAGIGCNSLELQEVYQLLRPYNGRAWLNFAEEQAAFAAQQSLWQRIIARFTGKSVKSIQHSRIDFQPPDGHVETQEDQVVLARTAALPGTGQWTHQHANPEQSVISEDHLVRPPFAPIWFGTTPNTNVLPRHHAGPRPQVAGGILAILGVETISARCVYTGRELWVREFPGIGHAFTSMPLEEKWRAGESVYMVNDPGATYIGSPFVTMPDGIYVRYQGRIYRLCPGNGEVLGNWELPAQPEDEADAGAPDWGHISVQGDCVIATSNPYIFMDGKLGKLSNGWDGSASRRLIVMNRYTGDVLWKRDAVIGFRHNAICSSGKILYVNDLLSATALDMALRRGMPIEQRPRLYALDLKTGRELWSVESDVFGTFLSYSSKYGILLEGGTKDGRQHLKDEPTDRLLARSVRDGEVLWERKESYSGPLIIHDDAIISGRPGPAICLLTGEAKTRKHPLTGEEMPWCYWKSYGCGSSNASTHLLLFRSGAAGFADLEHDGGTGNLGGFKSGCTASMIAADGILNAPDYTRTCTCSYQNQTSLGLVHRPEMELWAANQTIQKVDGSLRQLGLNFGAPGDRRAENGTLWLHVPSVAPSPEVTVLLECGNHDDGIRITAANAPERSSRPDFVFDGDLQSSWTISDGRKGEFSGSDCLEVSLSEEISLNQWQMAWSGPTGTQFAIQAKIGEQWETVYEGQDKNPGQLFATYAFPSARSRCWRVFFGKHDDESKDSRGRRNNQSVSIYELQLGDLPHSAYAFYSIKEFWRIHSLLTDSSDALRWIAASGVKDVRRLLLPASFDPQARYELSLIFSEPEAEQAGERVFDVKVQGHEYAQNLDVFALTGAKNRAWRLLCSGLQLRDSLEIDFPVRAGSHAGASLCGLELRLMEEQGTKHVSR